jgi:hypothetical protein
MLLFSEMQHQVLCQKHTNIQQESAACSISVCDDGSSSFSETLV